MAVFDRALRRDGTAIHSLAMAVKVQDGGPYRARHVCSK